MHAPKGVCVGGGGVAPDARLVCQARRLCSGPHVLGNGEAALLVADIVEGGIGEIKGTGALLRGAGLGFHTSRY